jgi:glycosyltransferase involved in cell wall biosynthesis
MAKVNIITRAFNRLEYTVKCISSVDKMAGTDDFTHIVINQASTDGTKQFLNSLLYEGYYKLKVKHNDANTGDAGGMKDGFDMLDDDCEYVMQWDNDCEATTPNFLSELIKVMDEHKTVGCIMLKRSGIESDVYVLRPTNVRDVSGHQMGDLPIATCVTIYRRKDLEKINAWFFKEKIGWGFYVTKSLRRMGFCVLKCLDMWTYHIDGEMWPNNKTGQETKYKKYFGRKTTKGSNYLSIDYDK